MSRILIAWELGGNLGHIVRLLALAKALRTRGHKVAFALRDVRASNALGREQFAHFQAPVVRPSPVGLPREPASYPEILFHCGFAEPAILTAAVRTWRELYRNLAPDLIVFDHAPTALLAARGTGIPRVVFGTGFASPPRVSPMPSIRPWQPIPLERLQVSEQRALESANAALRAIGASPLAALHELFDVEEDILGTLLELDHYGARQNKHYWGPVFHNSGGEDPRWPAGEGKKLFIYIRPNSPAFHPLATTLRTTNLRTLWFAPGLSDEAAAQLASPWGKIVREPIDISAVARSADAAVLHGGHGTTAAMLLRGVPVFLLPEHIEQLLLGRNVAALGAGAAFNFNLLTTRLETILEQLVHDSRFGAHARAFAAKHKLLHQATQECHMIMRLETLLRGPCNHKGIYRDKREASLAESDA